MGEERLLLEPRGRYRAIALRRTHGRHGPITGLELEDRMHPERRGWVEVRAVMARLIQPPGAAIVVMKDDKVLPVVLRLTSHPENQHQNDLIALPGCKGKWGRLEEE